MHVDQDRPARLADGAEHQPPEIVVAFRDAAFHVDAEGEPGDLGDFAQQHRQRVAAIRPDHRVVGAPTTV